MVIPATYNIFSRCQIYTLRVHFKNYQYVGLTGGLTGWQASTVRHAARSAFKSVCVQSETGFTAVRLLSSALLPPCFCFGFFFHFAKILTVHERDHDCSRSCIVGCGFGLWRWRLIGMTPSGIWTFP